MRKLFKRFKTPFIILLTLILTAGGIFAYGYFELNKMRTVPIAKDDKPHH